MAFSLNKGEKVIVHGRLQIRPFTTTDGRSMTSVGIEAVTIGHDLMWGISGYRRVTKDNPVPWAAIQAPGPESSTPGPWVDRETGEIAEGNEPLAPETADSAWGPGADEAAGEDLPGPSEDTVRAA